MPGSGRETFLYLFKAQYDGSDPGGTTTIDGREVTVSSGDNFREAVDDPWFDVKIDMSTYAGYKNELGNQKYKSAADFIIDVLRLMKLDGVDVTDVYFMDHGSDGSGPSGKTGMELGDVFYEDDLDWAGDSSTNLLHFAERLGDVTSATTTIQLRCCYGGTFAPEFACWSGRRTTGWSGMISDKPTKPDPDEGQNPNVADYEGQEVYYICVPSPTSKSIRTFYILHDDYYKKENMEKYDYWY